MSGVPDPVFAGEIEVEGDQRDLPVAQLLPHVVTVARLANLEPLGLEQRPQDLSDPGVVIDHENASRSHADRSGQNADEILVPNS